MTNYSTSVIIPKAPKLGRSDSTSRKSKLKKKISISMIRIKVDNNFLKNQNFKLLQELEQSRLTIQALKNIVSQKDDLIQHLNTENQKLTLKNRVFEALLLSKHSKDGSIILRTDDSFINSNNCNSNSDKKVIKNNVSPVSSAHPPPLPPKKANHYNLSNTSTNSLPSSPTLVTTIQQVNNNKHNNVSQLLRKPGNIIQSLTTSCNPMNMKNNGYDYSPSITPTSIRIKNNTNTYSLQQPLKQQISQPPQIIKKQNLSKLRRIFKKQPSTPPSPSSTPSTFIR
nr:6116_t:CDS:2 [Entrophospora candida]